MDRYFSQKDWLSMTDKEMAIAGYADELSLKYLQDVIKNNKLPLRFEDKNNIYVLHKSPRKTCKYQITYIWKKTGKPAGHIEVNNFNQAGRKLKSYLMNRSEFYQSHLKERV